MCTKRRESKKNCVVICMYTCIIKRDVHSREACKIMTVVLQSFVARVSKDTDCYQLYPSNALASSSCCMSVSLVYLSRSSCTALGEGRRGKQIIGRGETGTIAPLIVYMPPDRSQSCPPPPTTGSYPLLSSDQHVLHLLLRGYRHMRHKRPLYLHLLPLLLATRIILKEKKTSYWQLKVTHHHD